MFTAPQLDALEVAVLGEIDEIRQNLRYAISRPNQWLGLLRRSTFARAIRGSSSIEGYNATVEDAIAAVYDEDPSEASRDVWHAIVGYRNAVTFALQLSEDPYFQYSQDFLRSFHFMVMNHDLKRNPGRWRPGPAYIRSTKTKDIVYEAPAAEEVPTLVSELVQYLRTETKESPIVRGAMAHLNLVMIHPFSDGNGRMARCLQTLVLFRDGILEREFCSIEEYLGKNTDEYYEVLAETGGGRWSPHRDTRRWLRFNLTAHYRQAQTVLRRTKYAERVWGEVNDIVERLGLPDRTMLALADAAFGLRVRNSTYRASAEISENLASRDLKALVDAALLESVGDGRARYYVPAAPIREVRTRSHIPKHVDDPFDRAATLFPGFTPGPARQLWTPHGGYKE